LSDSMLFRWVSKSNDLMLPKLTVG
jgi:hypothetical protein